MQLEPGENLGDYRISAVLGEGGSAVVYAAEHLRAGRKVALKVFKQEVVQNHLLMQRIKREALIVNRVRHPSMVEIFDLVEIADRKPALCVLVMELLQGSCLDDLLQREGVLEPEDAVAIAAQVANALIALHNEKILHRDVKPQNIFLVDVPDQDPQVKLQLLRRTEPMTLLFRFPDGGRAEIKIVPDRATVAHAQSPNLAKGPKRATPR